MKVAVECCGATQRWCGAQRLSVELHEGSAVADLLQNLAERYPEFAQRRGSLAVARGDTVVAATQRLQDGDQLALIPPVSGG